MFRHSRQFSVSSGRRFLRVADICEEKSPSIGRHSGSLGTMSRASEIFAETAAALISTKFCLTIKTTARTYNGCAPGAKSAIYDFISSCITTANNPRNPVWHKVSAASGAGQVGWSKRSGANFRGGRPATPLELPLVQRSKNKRIKSKAAKTDNRFTADRRDVNHKSGRDQKGFAVRVKFADNGWVLGLANCFDVQLAVSDLLLGSAGQCTL